MKSDLIEKCYFVSPRRKEHRPHTAGEEGGEKPTKGERQERKKKFEENAQSKFK